MLRFKIFKTVVKSKRHGVSANTLQLNDKTEAILCGSKTQQSEVQVNSIYIGAVWLCHRSSAC